MECPKCASKLCPVQRTMPIGRTKIRRYRKCFHCHENFTTHEEMSEKHLLQLKPKKADKDEEDDNYYMTD